MGFQKNNTRATSSKAVNSKFSADVEGILDVTMGSLGPVTRSAEKHLGSQASQGKSDFAPIFGSSSPKGTRSYVGELEAGMNIDEVSRRLLLALVHQDLKGIRHRMMMMTY